MTVLRGVAPPGIAPVTPVFRMPVFATEVLRMKVLPLYVFATSRFTVALSTMRSEFAAAPEMPTVLTLIVPPAFVAVRPPRVRFTPFLLMPPISVSVPPFAEMVASDAAVIAPP